MKNIAVQYNQYYLSSSVSCFNTLENTKPYEISVVIKAKEKESDEDEVVADGKRKRKVMEKVYGFVCC